MAYPICCDACLDYDFEHCIENDKKLAEVRAANLGEFRTGGAFCIGRPKGEDNSWTASVRERDRLRREKRNDHDQS